MPSTAIPRTRSRRCLSPLDQDPFFTHTQTERVQQEFAPMQGLHKTNTTTLAAILGCLYALASPAAVDEPRSGPPVGAIAPDFKVKNAVTGVEVPLSSQKGKVVVMTFWAAWCPSCRQELPVLERVQEIVGKLGYGRGMITKLAAEINRALGVSATPTAEDPPARATALQPDKE